jgi:hypothetical protein
MKNKFLVLNSNLCSGLSQFITNRSAIFTIERNRQSERVIFCLTGAYSPAWKCSNLSYFCSFTFEVSQLTSEESDVQMQYANF